MEVTTYRCSCPGLRIRIGTIGDFVRCLARLTGDNRKLGRPWCRRDSVRYRQDTLHSRTVDKGERQFGVFITPASRCATDATMKRFPTVLGNLYQCDQSDKKVDGPATAAMWLLADMEAIRSRPSFTWNRRSHHLLRRKTGTWNDDVAAWRPWLPVNDSGMQTFASRRT